MAMRVIVNVGLVFDVETYTDAGQILDNVDVKLTKALRGKGKHEITGFQTRPCKAAQFDRAISEGGYNRVEFPQAYAEPDMAQPMQAMQERLP